MKMVTFPKMSTIRIVLEKFKLIERQQHKFWSFELANEVYINGQKFIKQLNHAYFYKCWLLLSLEPISSYILYFNTFTKMPCWDICGGLGSGFFYTQLLLDVIICKSWLHTTYQYYRSKMYTSSDQENMRWTWWMLRRVNWAIQSWKLNTFK